MFTIVMAEWQERETKLWKHISGLQGVKLANILLAKWNLMAEPGSESYASLLPTSFQCNREGALGKTNTRDRVSLKNCRHVCNLLYTGIFPSNLICYFLKNILGFFLYMRQYWALYGLHILKTVGSWILRLIGACTSVFYIKMSLLRCIFIIFFTWLHLN